MRRLVGAVLGLLLAAAPARSSLLADAVSVCGDSISRGFNANTGSCNYGDNVSRAWATGDDHGGSVCAAGGDGTFSHAERLECAKGGNVSVFNDAESGATMLGDFAAQAQAVRTNLSGAPAPRYVPVFLGHNDACTNTTSRTGNACGGDHDPDNYCRTTPAAFEREFRRGMDQLIQIPSVRIGVSALVRISQLCNYGGKDSCGLGFNLSCDTVWRTIDTVFGSGGICASLTSDCSNQRRVDMYQTVVAYNDVLARVTTEYAAIPAGGVSATGAVKAADVHIRFADGAFHYQLQSGDLSCCDCFHPSDTGQRKLAEVGWSGLQCSPELPCCAETPDALVSATCGVADFATFHPSGFWPAGACGNGILDPGESCDDGNTASGDCCSATCQRDGSATPCSSDGNVCTDDRCDAGGACVHVQNTAPCNDGAFCTVSDVCHAGICSGQPRDCSASADQCHDGVCDEALDGCRAVARAPGTSCDDGNACTQTDACFAGTCLGSAPLACAPLDQCHATGVCNPATGLCSNPPRPDGTACDDGDACTGDDGCTAGACGGASPCGDGVVQAACGERCDDGAGNGTNACCSGACQPVDPDGDGVCTRDDPCTGRVLVGRPRLLLKRLATPPGDDVLTFKGDLRLDVPVTPALDPPARGVRILVTGGAGAVVDVVLPAGAFDPSTGAGWSLRGGSTWVWRDPRPGRPGGIYKMVLRDRSAAVPGLLRFAVKGKGGAYAVAPSALPLDGLVILDPPDADQGACGTAEFPGPPPAPACAFDGAGSTLRCG
jgi:cysteine-rich repeat protein